MGSYSRKTDEKMESYSRKTDEKIESYSKKKAHERMDDFSRKADEMLEKFMQGMKSSIVSMQEKVLMSKIKNDTLECITSREGIADVFGEFYKRLYEEITTEELQSAISKLKKRHIPRQQWNTCRRHQSLRRRDERNDETNLQ